jgi:23S rRNA A1618 N6-methylase RlmF
MGMGREIADRCVWNGGVVQEIVLTYENKGKTFRYVICDPPFYETCERYIQYLRQNGIDFVKVSTTEREYLDEIIRSCYAARVTILK